ncbi:hypothetical protein [uncultured Mailhella sp.]|uniref:hypothetical protein n=1 Tax=uncultured Mailhella sp. TaxID=1981031 RepID=UPI0025D6115C|nr:hypothetical protein [uncultured Mailhella sp.]
MNKLFITLVGISITALVLAVGCGSWLFLKSWEEGKKLERQNQELKASLEASRIRIENFCEYPAEALCSVNETPSGSVSGAMADIADLTRSMPSPAEKNDGRADAASTTSSQAAHANADKPVSGISKPSASAATPMLREWDAPAQETRRAAAHANPDSEQEKNAVAETPSDNAALSENNRTSLSGTPSDKAVPASDKRLKKTWASLTRTKNSMVLRIAGEGPALTAEGRLLRDPLRYEVIMHGEWRVYDKNPDNNLVKEMRISFENGDTSLIFPLSGEPKHCNVSQEDPRTIAIVIR